MSSNYKVYDIGNEKYHSVEPLFQSSSGKHKSNSIHDYIRFVIIGIQHLLMKSINCCDQAIKSLMIENMVISGDKFLRLIYKKRTLICLGSTLIQRF
jgi:hypothetical protein